MFLNFPQVQLETFSRRTFRFRDKPNKSINYVRHFGSPNSLECTITRFSLFKTLIATD